jgi:Holliday junction DNA helicase RuvA
LIAQIAGNVARHGPDYVVVESAGVGYKVFASAATLRRIPAEGSSVTLYTHLHLREDGVWLYGFLEELEQEVFELLIGVSGIGPRMALGVLSGLAPEQILRAIAESDEVTLASAPGLGPKMARRLVGELHEKASLLQVITGGEMVSPMPEADRTALEDAVAALVSLGFPKGRAKEVAMDAYRASSGPKDASAIVREALRALA